MSMAVNDRPRLVFADGEGRIYDHPRLLMAGVDGGEPVLVPETDLLPLPQGSDLFTLPGRDPIGIDPSTGKQAVLQGDRHTAGVGDVQGVAAFMAPAHTLTHHPAYRTRRGAPVLPLFAYSAVGYRDGRFWTTGVRVDADTRQDPWRFDRTRLEKQVRRGAGEMSDNRVVCQLERCALEYGCRAAQNFFIGRHEAPLPTSIACNAQCVGCISLQPDGAFKASHDRLQETPSPAEIAAVALRHLEHVPDGVVSFGQGCEGEPLLVGEVLLDAVRLIRTETDRGTINLNSNASMPELVEQLARAGLDSMRVSLNSPRAPLYAAYYRPRGYDLAAVEASIAAMKRHGRRVSINYLVFPGVNDTEAEYEVLEPFIARTGIDMIQWRNLNIDPELYARSLPPGSVQPGFGMRGLIDRVSDRFPQLKHGYFNPVYEPVRPSD
jgi:pyruvate-formate lyase-activating enzyme